MRKPKSKPKTLPTPKEARAAANLTQHALANRAGCSVPTVARAERRGTYPPVPAVRRAYMAALGLTEEGVTK